MSDRPDYSRLFEAVQDCDLADVFRELGYHVRSDLVLDPNPLREERTPSLAVRRDDRSKWIDRGADTSSPGRGGDLIDFLQAKHGLDVEEARAEAARILGVPEWNGSSEPRNPPGAASLKKSTAKSGPKREPPVDYSRLVDQAHEALFLGTSATAHQARAYLKHRGFDLENGAAEILKRARVGVIDETVGLPESLHSGTYRGRLVFPYLDPHGRASFFQARAAADVENTEKFRKPSGGNQTLAFLRHAIRDDATFVILVEAELDALSVLAALGPDTPVLAAGGGDVKPEHLDGLLDYLEHVLLLYDADENGARFARSTHAALKDFHGEVRTLALPDGVKDVNEALTAYGSEALAVHLRREIAAARRTSDAAYITSTFLEELARRHARPDVAYSTGLAPIDRLLDGGYSEGLPRP